MTIGRYYTELSGHKHKRSQPPSEAETCGFYAPFVAMFSTERSHEIYGFTCTLENVRRHPHAQIHGHRGLRQGADRNMVDAGECIFANILERDST